MPRIYLQEFRLFNAFYIIQFYERRKKRRKAEGGRHKWRERQVGWEDRERLKKEEGRKRRKERKRERERRKRREIKKTRKQAGRER